MKPTKVGVGKCPNLSKDLSVSDSLFTPSVSTHSFCQSEKNLL